MNITEAHLGIPRHTNPPIPGRDATAYEAIRDDLLARFAGIAPPQQRIVERAADLAAKLQRLEGRLASVGGFTIPEMAVYCDATEALFVALHSLGTEAVAETLAENIAAKGAVFCNVMLAAANPVGTA